MAEIQNWNGKVKEVEFSRWDGIRDIQRYLYGDKKCYVLVFFNIKNGKSRVWNGFRKREMIVYSMKPDYHEKDIKNESVRKRVKAVFTKEEEKSMCIEEERLIKSIAKKMANEQVKKIEEKQAKKIEENEIAHVKFMFFSLGATPEKISEGIKMPLERVKAILAM